MAGLEWQFDCSLLGRMKLLTVAYDAAIAVFSWSKRKRSAGTGENATGLLAGYYWPVQEEELLVEHGAEPRPDLLPEQRRCCRPDFQSVELKIFFSQCLTGKKKKSLVLQDHGQLLSGGQLVAHRAAEEGGRRKTERGCEVSHG
ncbi:hypothetical protein OIU74_002746 [Salix koriyanagi]|uniref:Uncharacterized protein n=1 Tax=Salix koriyanagi TaxID=2511006 RepID=A0A9Q0X6M6_9ROSI|nr:hypothetical protein OIU74_002746 [Salix koriyanagi]